VWGDSTLFLFVVVLFVFVVFVSLLFGVFVFVVFGAVGDGDFGVLVYCECVLGGEGCGHPEFGFAEVAVGG